MDLVQALRLGDQAKRDDPSVVGFWRGSLKKPMGARARTGGGKPREGAMKRTFIMLAVSSSLLAAISGADAQHTVVTDQELMDKLRDAAPARC